MKSKHIADVVPSIVAGCLMISLDQEWVKVFGKIPTFSVTIDNEGKLNLSSIERVSKENKK